MNFQLYQAGGLLPPGAVPLIGGAGGVSAAGLPAGSPSPLGGLVPAGRAGILAGPPGTPAMRPIMAPPGAAAATQVPRHMIRGARLPRSPLVPSPRPMSPQLAAVSGSGALMGVTAQPPQTVISPATMALPGGLVSAGAGASMLTASPATGVRPAMLMMHPAAMQGHPAAMQGHPAALQGHPAALQSHPPGAIPASALTLPATSISPAGQSVRQLPIIITFRRKATLKLRLNVSQIKMKNLPN